MYLTSDEKLHISLVALALKHQNRIEGIARLTISTGSSIVKILSFFEVRHPLIFLASLQKSA